MTKTVVSKVTIHFYYLQAGAAQVRATAANAFPMHVTNVSGPGLQNGVLATYQGTFSVYVKLGESGSGRVGVNITGPNGRVPVSLLSNKYIGDNITEMKYCYEPMTIGHYKISIKCGEGEKKTEPIAGSPFNVHIVDSFDELDQGAMKRG